MVPRLEQPPRPRRGSTVKGTRHPCQFCEALDARLYLLAASPRERRLKDMVVCRFCYLRLAGVVPHRGQLARFESESAPATERTSQDPAGAV